MATPAAAQVVSTEGAEARAAAAAARAVRRAKRACDGAYNGGSSNQQPPVDFTSLGLSGWNRQGAQSLFRLAGGDVVFTGGRDVAHRATSDDGEAIVINVLRKGDAAPEAWLAAELLAQSDLALPGVLSYDGRRKGAVAQALRAEGVPATLGPISGVAPHEAIGLTLSGHEPRRLPLEEAMELLGLAWAATDGAEAEPPQAAAASKARATEIDELWLLGGQHEPAAWRRLTALRALGVHVGDDTPLTAGRAADFLAGVADAADDAGHAAIALRAAAHEAAQTGEGALVVVGDGAQRGMAAAGRDCSAALAAVLDAVGQEGQAEVAAGAYRLRAVLGVAAGAAARGALVSRALSSAAERRALRSPSPRPSPARGNRRGSPARSTPPRLSGETATTAAAPAGAESPFSLEIRRLTEARDAARAARAAAAAGGRALDFGAAPAAGTGDAPEPRPEPRVSFDAPPAQRQRTAPQLAELRPAGADGWETAQVLRRLEAELGGSARVSTEVSRAAGRGDALLLLAPDSLPAVRAAAEDWDEMVRIAGGAVAVWGSAAPPRGWAEAADRLMALLLAASPRGARRVSAEGAAPALVRPATRTLAADGELPSAATSKLVALKSDTGEAGRRAADAAVLEPLTTPAVQHREWQMEPTGGPVATLARMTAEPGYGDAVWAAVYSNGKYTGALAAEGMVPTSVVTARQQLVVLLRGRVEDAVGPDRLPEVRDEVRALVEGVMAADINKELAVKLLGGRKPSMTETRASTYEGVLRGGRWGSTKAATAAIDVPNAMMALGELLGMAHVLAGNGAGGSVVAFGLVELAQLACGADNLLPLEKGLPLFEDVFRLLRHEAEMRRTRPGWPRLDIGAIVRRIITRDFADAQRIDSVARAAAAAARDAVGAAGTPRGTPNPAGATTPHTGPGQRMQKPQKPPQPAPAPGPAPAAVATPPSAGAHPQRWQQQAGAQPPPPPPPPPPPALASGPASQPTQRWDGGLMRDGEGTPAEKNAASRLGMRAPPSFAPLSIGAKVAGKGVHDKVGAVEALEYLALLSEPSVDRPDFRCPWLALFKTCQQRDSGGCKHCAQAATPGARTRTHPAGAIARVRAASSARIQGFIAA